MSADLVDGLVAERVLVFGSLPPEARDLDLLVRPAEEAAIAAGLEAEGFVRRGREWARFRDCGVEAVELVPVARWQLPADELEALYAQARPLPGREQLVRPAPEHAVLILARRLARAGGALDAKRRRRLEQALQDSPDAWDLATARAPAWGAPKALAALRHAYETGEPVRARRLQRRRRGHVVSLSGIDGSGKTSQAAALRATLERLGYETETVWTRLSYNPSLELVAYPVKAVIRFARRLPRTDEPAADPAKEVRRRSAVLSHGWAAVVAVANGITQRRETRRHLRKGRVVICDRYSLDSAVHLRYRYGEHRRFRLQAALVRALSPRPVRAFLLDVPAETGFSRKAEQYDLGQLTRQVRLYREEHDRLGVHRLDGERPREELCAEIAREVWLAL